jgi:hypothetical protein
MTTKAELMALVEQRDALDAQIDGAMTELKLDAKGVKALKKAAEKAVTAQRTLDALMGVDPATAAQVKA